MSFFKLKKHQNNNTVSEGLTVPLPGGYHEVLVQEHPEMNVNSKECTCVIARTKDNHFLLMESLYFVNG